MVEHPEKRVRGNEPPRAEESDPRPVTGGLVSASDLLPSSLLLLPVAQTTVFPGMIVPLILPEGKLSKTIDHVLEKDSVVGIVLSSDLTERTLANGPTTSFTGLPAEGTVAGGTIDGTNQEERMAGTFYRYGVAAKILKRINLPDNQVSVLVSGLQRFRIEEVIATDPHHVANVKYLYDEVQRGVEVEALLRTALAQFKQLAKDNPLISEEVKVALVNIDGPLKLADFMASVLIREVDDYQRLLQAASLKTRLEHLLLILKKEMDVAAVQKKIQDDINNKVSQQQRDYYLNEQLKTIQKELGRGGDERSKLLDKFRERIAKLTLSEEAGKRINEELEKLASLGEQSSELSVAVNYLEWATSLPWGVRSDEHVRLGPAKRILDEDHYGLKDVKNRILEFLAVRQLRNKSGAKKKSGEGTILCLVGPPGTGKTSLGKSIARALGRKFFRFSVGGMRDEAEIKGHRRTYVGAMPGKFIQGLRRVGTQNPVFLIDEIDKMGTSWASGGDPSSALLELLDPEQNSEFLDHYLDIPFDASDVFFIATANSVETIPAALLDRLEIIYLHGYTDGEKLHIAREYLVPKQVEKNALAAGDLKFTDPGLLALIGGYARESGVRNLEKQISRVARKAAYGLALGKKAPVVVDSPEKLQKYLGQPIYRPEKLLAEKKPGVATGLAWTQYGGETLFVEATCYQGRGGLQLTGTLGKVMQESAGIAFSVVRQYESDHFTVPKGFFEKNQFHIHVPSGATPKDGPSAGMTIALGLHSLLTGRAMNPEVAMTGELSLTGRVLPVGGIKEKLLAAKRTGIKTVLIPKDNLKDLKEIGAEAKAGLKIVPIAQWTDAMRHVFPK